MYVCIYTHTYIYLCVCVCKRTCMCPDEWICINTSSEDYDVILSPLLM